MCLSLSLAHSHVLSLLPQKLCPKHTINCKVAFFLLLPTPLSFPLSLCGNKRRMRQIFVEPNERFLTRGLGVEKDFPRKQGGKWGLAKPKVSPMIGSLGIRYANFRVPFAGRGIKNHSGTLRLCSQRLSFIYLLLLLFYSLRSWFFFFLLSAFNFMQVKDAQLAAWVLLILSS